MTHNAPAPVGQAALLMYQQLFAAYPDALLLVNQAGVVVLANPQANELLGYTTEELVGLPVDKLVPDAVRPRHAAFRGAYALAPRARAMGTHTELVARRRDGSEVMVEIALSPLQDAGLPYVVAAVRGIGAYPRVKLALLRERHSEHLAQLGRLAVDARDAQALLQQVPAIAAQALQVDVVLIFLLEADQRHFRVCAGVGLVAGEGIGTLVPNVLASSPELMLRPGVPLVVADYQTETRFAPQQALLDAGLRSMMAVALTDRGRLVGAVAARSREPARFGDEDARFLGLLSDMLANALQRAQSEEALRHAQRLDGVGKLTGGIAHDFNNLLTIIQGNLQVLEEQAPVAEHAYAQQLLASASHATQRAAELTAKLLAFSRRQMLSPSRVDVGTMLRSLADMLRRTLEQNIAVELDIACSAPCRADAGQLESALLNLAINARDAMPNGGRLRFACRAVLSLAPDVAEELALGADGGDGYVLIDVADTGQGMPDAVRERAFEPFFTTKESGRGTGLGLATVYGFAKQSAGAVRLNSTPGAGTTVTLVLPRFADTDAPAGAAVAASESLPPGLKVLLVEDDAEVRRVVRAFLLGLGCVVTEFGSAEEALASLAASADHELLLSDIALGPGMRGTELARQLRQQLPGITCLLMSGYASDLLGDADDRPPAQALLRKPFDRSQLTRAVVRALAQRR